MKKTSNHCTGTQRPAVEQEAYHQLSRSWSTCCRPSAMARAATHVNTWPACDSLPAKGHAPTWRYINIMIINNDNRYCDFAGHGQVVVGVPIPSLERLHAPTLHTYKLHLGCHRHALHNLMVGGQLHINRRCLCLALTANQPTSVWCASADCSHGRACSSNRFCLRQQSPDSNETKNA